MGWAELSNGRLLQAAEAAGYVALITVDKGFAKQQNMKDRQISVLLLHTVDTSLEGLIPLVPALVSAMTEVRQGELVVIRPA